MIEVEPAAENSRRGYPTLTKGILEIHDEPQFDSHPFLPGFTIDNLQEIGQPLPYPHLQDIDTESPSTVGINVCNINDQWQIPDYFHRLAPYLSTMLGASLTHPRSGEIEVFEGHIDQVRTNLLGRGRGIGWHRDFPYDEDWGWHFLASNRSPTQVALLETVNNSIPVEPDEVDSSKIWAPEPGEFMLIDQYTAHRRPSIPKRKFLRSLIDMAPNLTKKNTPRKSNLRVLNNLPIYGDYEEVATEHLPPAIEDDGGLERVA